MTYEEQKAREEKEKKEKAFANRARWLPLKKYWLLYFGLMGTGILSMFAGIYLGLSPDEEGRFTITVANILFAVFYGGGFLGVAEGATLFWETKLVFHDVDEKGQTNKWQLRTAKVALFISISAVVLTGLAAADFLAVWRGNLSAFYEIQIWAQGWVVWSIPVLFVFHVTCAILYWYHSAEARLERWKDQIRRQTQSQMNQIEADAWKEEYTRIAPDLAKAKGRALAHRAASQDFYAEEERLGADLDGDGVVGNPQPGRSKNN
jgi:hypothetical protein